MKAQWLAIWRDVKAWGEKNPVIVTMAVSALLIFAFGVWTGSR